MNESMRDAQVEKILATVATGAWRSMLGRDGDPPPGWIPTERALGEALGECPATTLVEVMLRLTDAIDIPRVKAQLARDVEALKAGLPREPSPPYPPLHNLAVDFDGARIVIVPATSSEDCPDTREPLDIVDMQAEWVALAKPRPKHPLTPLLAWWLSRPRPATGGRVSTVGTGRMTRRPAVSFHARLTSWNVDAVEVDGEPMATHVSDVADLFVRKDKRKKDKKGDAAPRERRVLRPGDQAHLDLDGLAPLPRDLRLVALTGLHNVIAGDTFTLLTLAEALDRAIEIDEYTGAALLARTRDGGFRRPRDSDVERYWDAAAELHSLKVYDPAGSRRWAELAYVSGDPKTRMVTIGPPKWRKFGKGGTRWMLTTEGGVAGRARITAGRGGAAGRLVAGIEYFLGARYLGARGAPPDLLPASGKSGPGPVVTLPLAAVAALMGELDPTGTSDDARSTRKRLGRAIEAAMKMYQPAPGAGTEAPAGDSVEIVGRLRASRHRPAALEVRASARYVEATRLSMRRQGRGFQTVALPDWLGLDLSAAAPPDDDEDGES